MSENLRATLTGRLTAAIEALRQDVDDMPAAWILVLLRLAEQQGCTAAWLAEEVGLSPSVTHRVLQELGARPAGRRDALELIDSVTDPSNIKRKIYLLTNNGRLRVKKALAAAFGPDQTDEIVTVEAYRDALASNYSPVVKTDHFTQAQLARIRTAAARRYSDFSGDNFIAFPLEPAQSLIGPQQGADGESNDGLSGWVGKKRGRWFEMPTIYADEGGVALADFDDPNDAFHFVFRWRGRHEQ
jgi:DNA-binding MarR family transcriptional regulator